MKTLKPCQVKAKDNIIKNINNSILNGSTNNISLFIAPTGAGKTTTISHVINELIHIHNYKDYSFIFLTPGKSELEEQAISTFISEGLYAYGLSDALESHKEFLPCSVYSINWEKLNGKKNRSKVDTDSTVSYLTAISNTEISGTKIILIVDEEHKNNTNKSAEILNLFNYKYLIRMSATPNTRTLSNTVITEITEDEAIEDDLITQEIIINYNLTKETVDEKEEYKILWDNSIKTRNEIVKDGEEFGIKPLILIQFPDSTKYSNTNPYIKEVLDYIKKKSGWTIESGEVAVWFSDSKIGKHNLSNLASYDGPKVLLFKQAVEIGWNCPRAHILIKLRERGKESFVLQVFGRARRTFDGKRYEKRSLNTTYVYTYDIEYTNSLLINYKNAHKSHTLHLKDEYTNLSLNLPISKYSTKLEEHNIIKSKRYMDFRRDFYNYIVNKYDLSITDITLNKDILINNGFIFERKYNSKILLDVSVKNTNELIDVNGTEIDIKLSNQVIDNKKFEFYHLCQDIFQLHLKNVKYIFETFFMGRVYCYSTSTGKHNSNKKNSFVIADLKKKDYDYFILNNESLLLKLVGNFMKDVIDYRYGVITREAQSASKDFNFFDPDTRPIRSDDKTVYSKSVHSNFIGGILAPYKPEKLFLEYIETNDIIEFFFKNDDKGTPYLGIPYIYEKVEIIDSNDMEFGVVRHKKYANFYPDIIVKTINNQYFILEIKGKIKSNNGFIRDEDIDEKSAYKFGALKKYEVDLHTIHHILNVHIGFVRPFETSSGNIEWLIATEKYNVYTGSNGEPDDNWKSLDDYLSMY